jgi:hypothetical protein
MVVFAEGSICAGVLKAYGAADGIRAEGQVQWFVQWTAYVLGMLWLFFCPEGSIGTCELKARCGCLCCGRRMC